MEKLSYKLEVFEGPLDLLLHLISKNKLNIYDIPVSELLQQYLEHLEKMRAFDMDIASEFLEMAARLVYMKTVSLLPKHQEAENLRDELVGELLEYQVCREMALKLSEMTDGFNYFVRQPQKIEADKSYRLSHSTAELFAAYLAATGRGQRKLPPPAATFSAIVAKRIVSVSSKIVFVLRNIWTKKQTSFSSLFQRSNSRSEIVATFLAVLELVKAKRVSAVGDGNDMKLVLVEGGGDDADQEI